MPSTRELIATALLIFLAMGIAGHDDIDPIMRYRAAHAVASISQ